MIKVTKTKPIITLRIWLKMLLYLNTDYYFFSFLFSNIFFIRKKSILEAYAKKNFQIVFPDTGFGSERGFFCPLV